MSDDVHIGKDGWLFLSGGSNEVLKYYSDPNFFSTARETWLNVFRSRLENAERLGVTYRHITVPDKLSIYSDQSFLPLAHPEAPPATALPLYFAEQPDAERLLETIVPVRERMLAQKASGPQLYWKTDAHWTFDGCYLAYLELCKSINATPHPAIPDAPHVSGMLRLDLGAKLDPPIEEEYVTKLFLKDGKREFANELIVYKEEANAHDAPGLHVGSHIVFRNTASPSCPKTIVLFGDSYSEYRTHQLTGLLAETFAETHFIWSSNIDWNYVEDVKADIVVTEMAERFMNLVPGDDFNVREYGRTRLETYLASLG